MLLGSIIPSDDTLKLRKTLQQLQPVLHNKKLNVGVVKEQVGVAFTYLNIHLSAWFLESSGHCCSDNRGSTVPVLLFEECVFFAGLAAWPSTSIHRVLYNET